MAKVIIELEDVKDEQGISRVLTCVRYRPPRNLGKLPTKAENFAQAVAQVVNELSLSATNPTGKGTSHEPETID